LPKKGTIGKRKKIGDGADGGVKIERTGKSYHFKKRTRELKVKQKEEKKVANPKTARGRRPDMVNFEQKG